MVGDAAQSTVEQVLADEALTELIVDISGHYTFEQEPVAFEIQNMLDRLEAAQVPARRFVLDKIKRSIGKYVSAYHLQGLSSWLLECAKV